MPAETPYLFEVMSAIRSLNGLLLILFLARGPVLFSQDIDTVADINAFMYPNGLYIELLGPGAFYSAGYERILLNHEQFKTSVQAAFAWYPQGSGIRMMIPVAVNEIFSFGRNHLKIGAGTVVILKRFDNVEKNTGLLAHLRIGIPVPGAGREMLLGGFPDPFPGRGYKGF